MKINAITGISHAIIEELKKSKPRTIELQSAHNIITLTDVLPGDHIFLTEIDLDDLSLGDQGIIVEVLGITINMKRMVEYIHPYYCEERERMSARLKVKYVDQTFAKSVDGKDWVKPTRVDVICSCMFNAG
ncbi:DUF473 domain-containing protein [Methanomicrobium antiquum]|uniref:DUF473 domain-containing protein n=1 Tax=Methanomicrobium antiquum TaxID=487686 RepID=A0AAF0FQA7_9EURY|nr:DUF473 domain-containing protein [Methanomicrobium antiquum]MDD3976642.1 DUF473 domain-containing protein [Methanomicrobium sp.]WFN37710.1 DUF473 domain-containing protein [Methanomicrobium antiquum]